MDLNSNAYRIAPDNLLHGTAHPLDTRLVTFKNPGCELKRGCMVKVASDGSYFVAGDVDETSSALSGDVIGILSHDVAPDDTGDAISAVAYVSGGFNSHAVTGVNDYVCTENDILSAQKYGLYIH